MKCILRSVKTDMKDLALSLGSIIRALARGYARHAHGSNEEIAVWTELNIWISYKQKGTVRHAIDTLIKDGIDQFPPNSFALPYRMARCHL